MDTTLLIGANHVIRVEALKDVDHYSAHITEDLLTGMKLHANNWKSVYVHKALAIGEGPTTWQAYFNQQMRWAYGCMDVLFKHSPSLLPRMSLRRKLYYLWIQLHYFSGLAMMVSLATLGLYFFFGVNTAQINFLTFIKLYSLVLLVCSVMTWQLQKYNVRPEQEHGFLLAGKVLSIACWPIFFLALVGVIRGKSLTYKVTPKGHNEVEDPSRISFRVFRVHLLIGLYAFCCILAALIEHNRSAVMLTWAVCTVVLMFSLPFVLIVYNFFATCSKLLSSFINRPYTYTPNQMYAKQYTGVTPSTSVSTSLINDANNILQFAEQIRLTKKVRIINNYSWLTGIMIRLESEKLRVTKDIGQILLIDIGQFESFASNILQLST
jgi:cellulose synthase (UDP-forming)